MKVRASIGKLCGSCQVIARGKKSKGGKKTKFVYCKKNPRHNQRQG